MDSEPLVSCIIIFFNAEEFLEEAIQSVLAQTYTHWELLLVNDGSHDGSRSIAQKFTECLPNKIRLLEHQGRQNLGMSASRNLGILEAKGQMIAFLDADDLWLPGKLQQQVAILREHPEVGMIYGRTLIWHSWTGNAGDLGQDYTVPLGVKANAVAQPPTLFLLMLENKVQSPTTCNAMIRRWVFERVGSFEEDFRGMYEDQVFFAKVQLNEQVYVSGECWAKYRQHPQSCSASVGRAQDYETPRLPLLRWLADYLHQAGFHPNSEVWRKVQWELWLCRHPHMRPLVELPARIIGKVRYFLRMDGEKGASWHAI